MGAARLRLAQRSFLCLSRAPDVDAHRLPFRSHGAQGDVSCILQVEVC